MHFAALLPWAAAATVVTAQGSKQEPAHDEIVGFHTPIPHLDLAGNIWDKIKNAATCAGCESILFLLKGIAAFGDRPFVEAAKIICKGGHIQDDDVCDGLLELEGPTIARVIREVSLNSRTSKMFCGAILGLCEIPEVQVMNVTFPHEKPNTGRPSPSGKKPLRIVHFSDIHVDNHYTPGANTDCTKPICCRSYTAADAPGVSKNPAGVFGDHKCDTPPNLEDSMYEAIHKIVPEAAFAIFTGDIVDHTIWNTTVTSNMKNIDLAMLKMEDHIKTVYGTIGNHEVSPVNLVPSQRYEKYGYSPQWVYDQLASYWVRWTGEATKNDIDSIGAYAAKYPRGRLRIISLNTNMYYRHNFELYRKEMEADPNGQFAWLVKELDAAEQAGDRVYIIGHMPMGDIDALHDGSHTFDQIVNRYSDTIAAMFFGHTHVDHFEITYSDYNKREYQNARAMSYIAPSLTPTSGMPSFRIYDVDPETFAVLDSVQYSADMNNPDFNKQSQGPVWKKYYSAKMAYGGLITPQLTNRSAELTPAFWHNVTEVLENDAEEFDAYIGRKSRGWNPQPCTGDCQRHEICQLRGGRAENNCYKPKPGLNFSKRDTIGNNAHDDCGESVSAMTLAHLASNKYALDRLQSIYLELAEKHGVTKFDAETGWE